MAAENAPSIDDTLRRIGRNIVELQWIEGALKYFVSRQGLQFSLNPRDPEHLSLQEQLKQQTAAYATKTMGCLSRLFHERVLTEPQAQPNDDQLAPGEAQMRFIFRPFGDDGQAQKEFAGRLHDLAGKRNRLVHHLFSDFDLNSPVGRCRLALFLDDQFKEAQTLRHDLTQFYQVTQKFAQMIADPAMQVLPHGLDSAGHLVIVHLIWYAAPRGLGKAGGQGWCRLAAAGAYLQRNCSEAFTASKKKHRSLKSFVLASELFDMIDEQGAAYRIKPGYWLEIDGKGNCALCRSVSGLTDADGTVMKEDLDVVVSLGDRCDSEQATMSFSGDHDA